MDPSAILTLGVLACVFLALLRDMAPPDIVFLGATSLLALSGVISPVEAFAGFSNPGVLSIAALFIVAAGLRETGVLDWLGHHLLSKAKGEAAVLGRLAIIVLPMSAFLNNTPIVAMLISPTMEWARRQQISPSKLLIPLSYLAIFGGTCTLIGTSTNLVVDGLMLQHGVRGMGLFEIGAVGVPYAIIGFVYLRFVAPRLLPDRKDLLEQLEDSRRDYLVEMLVQPECRFVGQTIEAAGLRSLPALFLMEIVRGADSLGPVGPDEIIRADDRLIFTGVVSSIIELEKIPGLLPAADPSYEVSAEGQRGRRLCEAVVSAASPLVGKNIRDAQFRASYGAAVVAVHRGGSRVEKKVGDITLRPGNTLLLQTGAHFVRAQRNNPAFYLVSDIKDWRPLRRDRAWLSVMVFVGLVILMAFQLVPTVVACMSAAVGMIVLGCISSGDARRSVEWQVLIAIASAFGVGSALENSGVAALLAQTLVDSTVYWGPIASLLALYVLVSILTELITNNAAAVLLFPICFETANAYGLSPRPFLMILVLAASASFMTPIGYQTNMMVYGPGGYRFNDFLRVGAPLKLLFCIVAVVLVPMIWPL